MYLHPRLVQEVGWISKTEKFCNPAEGIITSSCGVRKSPILKKQEFHEGLDIALPEGTPVVAVKSGVVTSVRQSESFGLILEYQTTDGFSVVYAHLQKVLVAEGEQIQKGQNVAKSGNSGWSTGPHLHYGLKKDGMIVDPMDVVSLPHTKEVEAEYAYRKEKMPKK